tara:strand:+ start:1363 stop:2475 length:1113 start_codon:yes stop_codon:yes gene_type:complete
MMDDLDKVNELDKVSSTNSSTEFVVVDHSASDEQIKKVNVSDFADKLNKDASSVKGEKGDTGPKGIRGRAGPRGDDGDYGDSGERGIKGVKGVRGYRGLDGVPGAKGAKGTKGAKGATGPRGTPGNTGSDGYIGPQGDKGQKGSRGELGQRGSTGPKGLKGSKGHPGPQLNGVAPRGDPGEPGQPGLYGVRGDRGPVGDVGRKGPRGQVGEPGDDSYAAGRINHALYGARSVRDWTKIDITPGQYIHLSYFKNGSSASYKFIKFVLELPSHDNILPATNPLVINLMNPGQVSNFTPVLFGQPPIVWIKSATDNNSAIETRSASRTPRVPVLEMHPGGDHVGVYIPTHNTQFINDFTINLNIIEMYGTNDM